METQKQLREVEAAREAALEALTSSGSRVSIPSVDDNVPLDLTAEGCLVDMVRDTLGGVCPSK